MGRLHSNQPTANSPLYVQNDKYWLHTLTKLSPLSGNHAHAHKVSGKFSLRVCGHNSQWRGLMSRDT